MEGFDKVEGARLSIDGHLFIDLRYAADETLFSGTIDAVQQKLVSVRTGSESYVLFLNATKRVTKTGYERTSQLTDKLLIIWDHRYATKEAVPKESEDD